MDKPYKMWEIPKIHPCETNIHTIRDIFNGSPNISTLITKHIICSKYFLWRTRNYYTGITIYWDLILCAGEFAIRFEISVMNGNFTGEFAIRFKISVLNGNFTEKFAIRFDDDDFRW